jgi:4'-phosphopantetheinyl transferase
MTSTGDQAPVEILQVWCADVPAPFDEALQEAYLSLLSTDERAQWQRLRFDALRHRFLLTRALVRTVLSRHVPTPPAGWRFARNEYGRPFIADPPPGAGHLRFSISHTDALVVLVLASGREVGIDVECTRRHAPLDVAQRYFSLTESAELAALPAERQAARFWDLWTLKESYVKARGMGLSLPLDAFTFRFGDGLSLEVEPTLNDTGTNWHFWQFVLPGDHHMALCAQRLGPQPPRCEFRHLLPLREEAPLTPAATATG